MPRIVHYNKGSISYFTGDVSDNVFILQKGSVVLSSKDIETGEAVTERIKPGEFFGVKSAMGHFPREETASVVEDSDVVLLALPEFEKIFMGNKDLMLKMLKAFSGQLRKIHRKIDDILYVAPVQPSFGMLSVAKSFYNDEHYRSCCDICEKILKRFPNMETKNEVCTLYNNAKIRYEKLKDLEVADEDSESNEKAMDKAFLSGFERFSKTYEKGQVIISEFEPGDTFYLIQSGEVQLIKCVNDGKKNLDILKAGEFFGEMAILDNSPRSATCVAKTKVQCLEFSKENFSTLISGTPQLAFNLLRLFCKRIYDQKRRFRILVIKDPYVRVADVFMLLYELNPDAAVNSRECRFKVTVDDIAQWAGLSKEITRNEIDKFVEKHKIKIYDDVIAVYNISEMKRVVDYSIILH